MFSTLSLPRLFLGSGALSALPDALAWLGVRRPLLMSDRGLERAGAVAVTLRFLPDGACHFLDVPENPTNDGADAAHAAYRAGGCDGVVALGGGSVIDTAKFVAALAGGYGGHAANLLGNAGIIGPDVVPLVAIPTTVGTGSESSPATGMHSTATTRTLGTRSQYLVPRVAICDPALARTLPARLIAATGMDAVSHCIEGFFAVPAHPVIDALALDGLACAVRAIHDAMTPDPMTPKGEAARAALMAAAFNGGVAIHKGLGPAHAIATACGDQGLHHGVLCAVALPSTVALVAPHAPAQAARLRAALGLAPGQDLAGALRALNQALGLPATLREAGYRAVSIRELVDYCVASPFNRTSPYVPSAAEYETLLRALLD